MIPSLPELLERAGFTLRIRGRATCAYCEGRDRTTVSYSDDLAHCHRCHWKTNRIGLARQLGLLSKDPTPQEREEIAESKRKLRLRREFESWRNIHLERIISKLEGLHYRARIARKFLALYPEDEESWNDLAALAHGESSLHRAFDFFSMTKASNWLDKDATLKELVALRDYERTGRTR